MLMRYEANKSTSNNSIWFQHADARMALPCKKNRYSSMELLAVVRSLLFFRPSFGRKIENIGIVREDD